tara:strand:+ start:85 stop:1236 length:1152 start_codon:yes stop_codon:yes gene_type:complete
MIKNEKKVNLTCTIVSHTPYYRNKQGEYIGLNSTVEEIDEISKLFKKVLHCAPLHSGASPKSFVNHQSKNISVIPLIPSGGLNFKDKMNIIFLFPKNIKTIKNNLKNTDLLHFRAPTGIGVLFIPWIYLFWSKGLWIKYAGSWVDNEAPIGYKAQRLMLKLFPKTAKISINGNFENNRSNFLNFINPCHSDKTLKRANVISMKKDFNKKLRLLFVGRLEKKKGLDDVFSLLKSLDNYDRIENFTLIGDSNDFSRYEKLAKNLPFDVHILGALPRKIVFNYYEKSDILLLLSKTEGFPKVIMEAGAFGCVPALSSLPNFEPYINHNINGIILKDRSPKEFASTFEKIISDANTLKKMSNEITVTAKLFTYENYLSSIKTLILND